VTGCLGVDGDDGQIHASLPLQAAQLGRGARGAIDCWTVCHNNNFLRGRVQLLSAVCGAWGAEMQVLAAVTCFVTLKDDPEEQVKLHMASGDAAPLPPVDHSGAPQQGVDYLELVSYFFDSLLESFHSPDIN
jgi:hypothetical protein